MDEPDLEAPPALAPHTYPAWIKLFAAGVLVAMLYTFALTPRYLAAVKDLRAAEAAYRSGDYRASLEMYRRVLRAVPTSYTARVGAALVMFSEKDKRQDEAALEMLHGVSLQPEDAAKLLAVVPADRRQYFLEETR